MGVLMKRQPRWNNVEGTETWGNFMIHWNWLWDQCDLIKTDVAFYDVSIHVGQIILKDFKIEIELFFFFIRSERQQSAILRARTWASAPRPTCATAPTTSKATTARRRRAGRAWRTRRRRRTRGCSATRRNAWRAAIKVSNCPAEAPKWRCAASTAIGCPRRGEERACPTAYVLPFTLMLITPSCIDSSVHLYSLFMLFLS